jgi:predicted ABC-type ATPase
VVRAGKGFVLETTLSGRGYARAIPKWREAGYEVELHYLSLRNVEGSMLRVAARVAQGGHSIPEDAIIRRFDICHRNFHTLYKDLVNHWYLYDNSSTLPRLLASGSNPEWNNEKPE